MDERKRTPQPEGIEQGAPTPVELDEGELHRKCRLERDQMEAEETADCAGEDLAERYQNEEDGGS